MSRTLHDLVRRSLDRNVSLLLSAFNDSKKRWDETPEDDPLFVNYVAVWACCAVGLKARAEVRGAIEWINGQREPSGIWTYERKRKPMQATARALIALLLADDHLTQDQVAPSITYILSRRSSDGGWTDEESDVPSGATGIGQSLPAIFALRLYANRFESTPELATAMQVCREWLKAALSEYRSESPSGEQIQSAELLTKYAWLVRGYKNAVDNLPSSESQLLSRPLVKALDPTSIVWTPAHFQTLYNVVHSLGSLGVALDGGQVAEACLWMGERFLDLTVSALRIKARELRLLAGTIITEASTLSATPGYPISVSDLPSVTVRGNAATTRIGGRQPRVDIVVVTAMHDPEFKAARRLFHGAPVHEKYPDDTTVYLRGIIDPLNINHDIHLVLCTQESMGMTSAAVLATKAIHRFRPNYLVMVGIAAGIDKKSQQMGDILIAEHIWEYSKGKIKTADDETLFSPTIYQENVRSHTNCFEGVISPSNKESILAAIRQDWNSENKASPIRYDLQVHHGPFVSGPAVVENEEVRKQIETQHKKMIGLDMEGFAVVKAAIYNGVKKVQPLVIKAICDFGDEDKQEQKRYRQELAAFTSVKYFHKVAIEQFEIRA
jgi:nucleoside phosphorylase